MPGDPFRTSLAETLLVPLPVHRHLYLACLMQIRLEQERVPYLLQAVDVRPEYSLVATDVSV